MTVSNVSSRSLVKVTPPRFNALVLRSVTTTATPTVLTTDGLTANEVNQIIFLNDSTYSFTILVVARRTDADGGNAGWEFKGVATRDVNATSTSILGVSKSTIFETNSTWDCNVAADTTYGGIKITVTGEAGKTISWAATVNISEVTG